MGGGRRILGDAVTGESMSCGGVWEPESPTLPPLLQISDIRGSGSVVVLLVSDSCLGRLPEPSDAPGRFDRSVADLAACLTTSSDEVLELRGVGDVLRRF